MKSTFEANSPVSAYSEAALQLPSTPSGNKHLPGPCCVQRPPRCPVDVPKKQKVVLCPKGETLEVSINPWAFFPDPLACWLVFLGSSASPVSPPASRKPNSDGANRLLSRCEGRVKSEEGSFPQDSGNCGENAKQRPIGGERGPASRHGPCLTRCLAPLVSTPIYPPALTHLTLLTWESLPHTPLPLTLAQEP